MKKIIFAAILTILFSIAAFGQAGATNFTIKAGTYYSFPLNNHKFDFAFAVANYDIEVLIFEQSNFVAWQNSQPYRYAYFSGRVKSGRVRLKLDKDYNYVMVLSNTYASFYSKQVSLTQYKY